MLKNWEKVVVGASTAYVDHHSHWKVCFFHHDSCKKREMRVTVEGSIIDIGSSVENYFQIRELLKLMFWAEHLVSE